MQAAAQGQDDPARSLYALAPHLSAFLAAVAASEGRDYRYPFTIRFVS